MPGEVWLAEAVLTWVACDRYSRAGPLRPWGGSSPARRAGRAAETGSDGRRRGTCAPREFQAGRQIPRPHRVAARIVIGEVCKRQGVVGQRRVLRIDAAAVPGEVHVQPVVGANVGTVDELPHVPREVLPGGRAHHGDVCRHRRSGAARWRGTRGCPPARGSAQRARPARPGRPRPLRPGRRRAGSATRRSRRRARGRPCSAQSQHVVVEEGAPVAEAPDLVVSGEPLVDPDAMVVDAQPGRLGRDRQRLGAGENQP